MIELKILRRALFAVFVAAALAGCADSRSEKSAAAPDDAAAFESPTDLKAVLTDPTHIDLSWKNHATEAGGLWVEFATPGSDFVMLDPLWPQVTTYRHPDVAPETQFIYRLKPFFGRPSTAVSVTTGPEPKPGAPDMDEEGPLPGTDANP